jgi:2-dehydropantoate 2-reductase
VVADDTAAKAAVGAAEPALFLDDDRGRLLSEASPCAALNPLQRGDALLYRETALDWRGPEGAMKIAVMGAGAVGSYFGAVLARGGHEVVLVGRPAHVAAIAEKGLFVDAKAFRAHVPIAATTEAAGVAGAEAVLVAVKSADSEAAGRAMLAHVPPEAAVLSLQNGVDNAERLAAAMGRPVIPVAVYVATEIPAPGKVKHHGRGELVIGPSGRSAAIAAAFTAAGVPTSVSPDVIGTLWAKLAVNCAYNALSAVAQRSYGDLVAIEEARDLMRAVVGECEAVAQASGIALPAMLVDQVFAIAGAMPGQFSSTAQDVARGKASEIDYLNGFVVRKGRALGIPTPANLALVAMVKLVETKARP